MFVNRLLFKCNHKSLYHGIFHPYFQKKIFFNDCGCCSRFVCYHRRNKDYITIIIHQGIMSPFVSWWSVLEVKIFRLGEEVHWLRVGHHLTRHRPVPIVLVKCWKVAHWNAKKLLKNCQKSKKLLPKFLAIFI